MVREIVNRFGGQTALAGQLGVGQSAIAYWVKKGTIPSKWHSRILALALDLKVDVTAADLVARDQAPEEVLRTGPAIPEHSALAELDDGSGDQPFMFYQASDGAIKVQVRVEDETIWASQRGMADIFGVDHRTISEHLGNIFDSGELIEDSVVRKFRNTALDGKAYQVSFYSLDAVISVGYRVSSYRATQFRVWATSVLKEYMIKGFALDDDRLKQGKALFGRDYFEDLLEKIREIRASERRFYQKITDIYAQCSVDYDAKSPITQRFYAHVQDKLHYAIHGKTSAELISARADASKPAMGLTSWKNEGRGGKITKSDVTVGKNYLTQEEIKDLEFLVSMYLDWATNFARRRKTMTMADWATRFDGFLEFNAYEVLHGYGHVSRDDAARKAVTEYEKFRVVQDKDYQSDFDRVVEDVKIRRKLPSSVS
ncbi:cell filamentation protein Fic [Stenotrophomonas maltophilia]|uniref:Cell filamentation protein Fic n=1 Tax=Stenotrophomonas maltophilia TaxID=40324 RepID=A0A270MZQ7_STEMA|nr:RhuM family protein [Stenotrophomonas maltophilia]PAM64442.1 cell filamentation protein Fic [Stenotrophomonas maltophilia]PAM66646.1 cell filamentation protein Fic [Stenotrophomonas maltophilia]